MTTRRRSLRIAVLAAGIACSSFTPASLAQSGRPPDEKTWRVVVLNNADFLLPASAIMDQALRETLTRESPHPVEFFGEALDSFRHPGTIDDALNALLRRKYQGIKVDLVMARSRASIDFVGRYRDELWPGVPVVFYNELPESWRDKGPPANATGVLIDLDPVHTIDLALRLHPGASNIYVVGGISVYDQNWKRRLQPLLSRLKDPYTVTWLDHLPLPKILETVGALPRGSIVLYTAVMLDAEGRTRTNPQVAAQVAAASVAPVYGFFDTYIGGGVVGGAIPDFAAQGRAAARLAQRVLHGEPAAAIPVEPPLPARCVVDERAMRHFRIKESLLPANCDIRFRAPSVWRDYRWHVIAVVAAIVLQAGMIGALIVQRRQRKRAELAAHQQRVELAHTLRLATIGEMTAAISHEINQPLGAILSNAEAAEMLLDSDVQSTDQLRQILADIRRDDIRASEVVRRLRAFLQKHEVRRQMVDPNDLVTDTVRLLGAEAARRDIALNTQTVPASPLVHGDRVQLQQLLINLVLNAMDAMAETPATNRSITLRVSSSQARKLEIAVSDAGHGIEPGTIGRLFDSFFTTKPKGLGLGLSIARTIAEAHGGSIRAENNPSGGATFRVTLPEAREEPVGPPAIAETSRAGAT